MKTLFVRFTTVIAIAGIALLVASRFVDWQVAMVKTGMRYMGSPEVGEAQFSGQSRLGDSTVNYQVDIVAEGLELPWSLQFIDEHTALVSERSGHLQRVDLNSGEFTEITGVPDVYYKGQGGFFDIALHPQYPQQPWVYLSYAVPLKNDSSTTRLARASLQGNELVDLEVLYSVKPVLETKKHYGGRLLFHDGFLYMTMGERGRRHLSQKLDNDLGSVLRFNIDGSIPDSNPFYDTEGASPAVYSHGHRNPQGFVKHPVSGELWVSEHGPQGGDEINLVKAGANYGWPVITYGEEYGGGQVGEGLTEKEGLEQPLHYYVPSIGTGNLAFYSGDAFPEWQGDLFVTGLRSFDLSHLQLAKDESDFGVRVLADERLLGDMTLRQRDIKIDSRGWIYIVSENGSIARIRPVDGQHNYGRSQ